MRKLLIIPCILFFCSCTSNKHEDSAEKNDSSSASACTHIDDAKTFLPSWSKENVLVYHIAGEPADLHPANGNTAIRNEINLYTQMCFIITDHCNQSVAPGIVKYLPEISADGLQYTYELRDDLKWDDESHVTIDDVLFTFKAIKCALTNNPHAKPYWQNLWRVRLDTGNARKFILMMKHSYIQNISFLVDYPVMQEKYFDPKFILKKYMVEQFGDSNFKAEEHKDIVDWSNEFNNEKYGRDVNFLTGLGPYAVESWDAGQSLTLVKKKNHFTARAGDYHEAALPEKIIFKINRDDNSTMLEFKSQTYDASALLSAKNFIALKENEAFNKNYNSLFGLTFNYTYIAMNEKPDGVKQKKIFTDVNVRHAMAYLTPVDDIIKLVYKNYSSSCRRLAANVSPVKKEYNSDLTPIPLNIEKAKQLLDEAGWIDSDDDGIRDKIVDGENLKLSFDFNYFNTLADWKDMASLVAEQMLKAGVKANLVAMDPKVFIEKARNHDFQMMMSSWGSSALAEDYGQLWHSQAWKNGGSNYAGFGNANSDALIDSINFTLDETKRTEMSRRLQKMIYDDQPLIPLYTNLRRMIVHKRFGNCNFYSERPGIMLNNFKLLSGAGGVSMKDDASTH
jgi:peptide/nickel transport system substrate-binding protein